MTQFKDSQEIIEKFTSNSDDKKADYLKRENSNFVYSVALLRHNIGNNEEENYLMNKIFSPELRRLYEQGYIYPHDKKLAPYCVSLGCKDVATAGIPTIAKNMLASAPTKRLKKLLRHFSNAVVLISQQASGAVMLSQMTTVTASYLYYEEKELGKKWTDEDLREEIQSLIWELNMPLRAGSQSAFSNITLEFGKASPEIAEDYVIIGGEGQDYQYKDIPASYFDRVNKAIIDVMAKGSDNSPFTFPLITVPITDDFHFDNPMFLYLLDKMYNWGGVYFENFRTKPFENEHYRKLNPCIHPKDPSVSRSLCPLDGTQEVIYYSDKLRKFITAPIQEVYRRLKGKNIKIISNGKVVEANINKVLAQEYAEITLVNGLKFKTTLNHLNKTLNSDEKPTSELTTNDYLPFSRKILEGYGLSYEEGKIIGAFLGDGSFGDENTVTFSLNETSKKELLNWLEDITKSYGGYSTRGNLTSSISGEQSCINLYIHSRYFVGLIKDFVIGDSALTKELNLKAINMSVEFRRGIIDGLLLTDGNITSNRIYTSSKKLVTSLITLGASLGIPARISEDNREGRLGDNTCYTVRFYSPDDLKTQYKDVYKLDDDFFWFKIKSIKRYKKQNNSYAYCFEVLNGDDPFFMLPNGVLTHNCRLTIDLNLLKDIGGGIFGSSTGSTGAVQVINLDINRLLIEFGNTPELFEKIDHCMEVMEEGHQAKRQWIENNRELYPTFFAYNVSLKNYFNVFALTGMNEGLINAGFEGGMKNKEGQALAHKIMQFMTDKVNYFIKRDKVACGIEYAPQMRGSLVE
jgi:hypothetical protein